jgi:hypothetical protein
MGFEYVRNLHSGLSSATPYHSHIRRNLGRSFTNDREWSSAVAPALPWNLPEALCTLEHPLMPLYRNKGGFVLSCLGSAPNSVSGASPAQLPYAARAASSAVRLRSSLRTSLLATYSTGGRWSSAGWPVSFTTILQLRSQAKSEIYKHPLTLVTPHIA